VTLNRYKSGTQGGGMIIELLYSCIVLNCLSLSHCKLFIILTSTSFGGLLTSTQSGGNSSCRVLIQQFYSITSDEKWSKEEPTQGTYVPKCSICEQFVVEY